MQRLVTYICDKQKFWEKIFKNDVGSLFSCWDFDRAENMVLPIMSGLYGKNFSRKDVA